jgi:hypothetical protein
LVLILVTATLATTAASCARTPAHLSVEHADWAAPAGSIVPQVAPIAGGGIALSWLEPLEAGGYRFRMATRQDASWSEARTIASSPDIIMFSADLPGLVQMSNGTLLAYWQHADRRTSDPYATAIRLSQSDDEGRTWSAPVTPHRDGTAGQHGFIAAFPLDDGAGLVWLDAERQRYVPSTTPDGKGARASRARRSCACGRAQDGDEELGRSGWRPGSS